MYQLNLMLIQIPKSWVLLMFNNLRTTKTVKSLLLGLLVYEAILRKLDVSFLNNKGKSNSYIPQLFETWGTKLCSNHNFLKGQSHDFFLGYKLPFAFSLSERRDLSSWTKVCRQIHKIKKNRFFYGMFYDQYLVIF